MSVAESYSRGAQAWATGAGLVYVPLAEALLELEPADLGDRWVLDAGAGTGAAAQVYADRGARVVAGDLSAAMLLEARDGCSRLAVADIRALPFPKGAFASTAAAFVLNHLDDPSAGLAELARVTHADGSVLVSTFSNASAHEGRARVDETMKACGWEPPGWYRAIKQSSAPQLGSSDRLAEIARRSGCEVVEVVERDVDVGVDEPEQLVEYRLGQAHFTDFLAGLDPKAEHEVRAAAIAAAGPDMEPFRPTTIFLRARPGRR